MMPSNLSLCSRLFSVPALLSALVLAMIGPVKSNAATIFFDDFNSENGGAGAINYASFANWNVSDGTVDLIGTGFIDLLPGNGLYVDMDGSTSNAGKLTSKTAFSFVPGTTYTLEFDLAGNQRNGAADSVIVEVAMGAIWSQTFSLNLSDPFTTFSHSFTVASPQAATISFEGTGGDNVGMLLDDVRLTSSVSSVPDGGATLISLGFALVLLGLGLPRAKAAATFHLRSR